MNKLLNAMKEENNHAFTENGGRTYRSTMSGLMDLFALGGAYRNRKQEDCALLFMKAFEEDEIYAMKCLFYLRDIRGGQGERRFFRSVANWLANNHPDVIRRNLENVAFFGRWDDMYAFVGTPLEKDAFDIMKHQLALDVSCETPSLLAKWLASENTSSELTRRLATKTRKAFNMTSKQYRKTLSILRERIRVLERLMSQNRWDEIEFDKIPSRAGLIYRNAFARKDLLKDKYKEFAESKDTKVNAEALYPCDVVSKAYQPAMADIDNVERLMINKYWDNLADVFKNAVFDGVAVVDTSFSMTMGGSGGINPIDVAIALGLYCAEKCSKDSPWHGHYISFSHKARLIEIEGIDFCDKARRIYDKNLCEDTNIKSVFSLILKLARKYNVPQSEMPKNIVIISDMEFNECTDIGRTDAYQSEMEALAKVWNAYGYELPHLIFWNVNARQNNIPMRDNGRVSFVSGYSPVLFEQILTGKTGMDLVKEKLDSPRYERIH